MAFVVPCVAIVVCYARIFYIVRKTAMRSHEPPMLTTTGSMYIHPATKNAAVTTKNNNIAATKAMPVRQDDADKQLIDHNTHRKLSSDNAAAAADAADIPLTTSARRNRTIEPEGNSGNSSSMSYNIHPRPMSGPKIFLKFIDSSVDSDLPPSLSRLRMNSASNNELKPLAAGDRNMSSVSISKNVEFREDVDGDDNFVDDDPSTADGGGEDSRNGSCEREMRSCRKKRRRNDRGHEVDSAVEESTSSSENNQVRKYLLGVLILVGYSYFISTDIGLNYYG